MKEERFRELYKKFSESYQELYDRRPVIYKSYPPHKPIYMYTFGEDTFLSDEEYEKYKNPELPTEQRIMWQSMGILKNVQDVRKSVLWNIQGYNCALRDIYNVHLSLYNDELLKLSKEKGVPVAKVNNLTLNDEWRKEVISFLNRSYTELINECNNDESLEIDISVDDHHYTFGRGCNTFYDSISAMGSLSPHFKRDNLTPHIVKKLFRKIYATPNAVYSKRRD